MSEQDRPAEDAFDSMLLKPSDTKSTEPSADIAAVAVVDTSPGSVQKTLDWLSRKVPWRSAKSGTTEVTTIPPGTSESTLPIVLQMTTGGPSESADEDSEKALQSALYCFTGLLVKSTEATSSTRPETEGLKEASEIVEHGPKQSEGRELALTPSISPTRIMQTRVAQVGAAGTVALDAVRSAVVSSLVAGIRMVAAERDRDEMIRWFVKVRGILARDSSTTEKVKELYQSVDTLRFAKLLAKTVATSISSYQRASLPLSLKVALPVTAVGATFFPSARQMVRESG